MTEEIINKILVQDLPTTLKVEKSVNSKPYVAIYTILITSIILIATQQILVLGLLMFPIALILLWKVPNFKHLDICSDRLIIYFKEDKTYCQMIMYTDIKEWVLRNEKTTGDQLVISLQDGNFIKTYCFNSSKVVSGLNKNINHLEANVIKKASIKNTPFKWPGKK